MARLARSQRHRKRMPIVLLSTKILGEETKALAKKEKFVECELKIADFSKLLNLVIVTRK